MQPEFEVRTPSLSGSTELLVMAPIRSGFVPALDTLTYKSRVQMLLEMLHAGRQGQHEYRLLRAVSDAVERVGVIRSLRVAVVEGRRPADDRILLSVHFDGSYEAYARTIWQRAARLLDLIFCNAEGYVTGWDHPFDDWNAWIRSVQVPTPFFYATPGLTYADQTHLTMFHARDRGDPGDETARTRLATPTAEEIAWRILKDQVDPTRRDDNTAAKGPLAREEAFRQNLAALTGLYRLIDSYPSETVDGDVLRRAAHEMLPQLADALGSPFNLQLAQVIAYAGGPQMAQRLKWFGTGLGEAPPSRGGTTLPERASWDRAANEVQSGILRAYDGVTDGAMVLVAFANPASAAGFLEGFRPSLEGDADAPGAKVFGNFALTFEGLRACGLSAAQLESWPLEFRQGMAARAGLLGDVRGNHPRRWTLPRRNGALDPNPDRVDAALPPLPLETVHAIVQFRARPAAGVRAGAIDALSEAIRSLSNFAGVTPLSVQWMARRMGDNGSAVDHFGYTDGQSQPVFDSDPQATAPYKSQVHMGEVLVGYANAADRECDLAIRRDPDLSALMCNGSFLAVRKLRQDVAGFRRAVERAASGDSVADALLRAKLMGRWPADAGKSQAGLPLAPLLSADINDFDYRGDEHGDTTPLAAHVRRANPRGSVLEDDFPQPAPGARPPRLMRRSLPYGPPPPEDGRDDSADRGLVFMAYNASLAEQFEVVQGWLAGGNSSRAYSRAACPFLGVPEVGRVRRFRYLDGNRSIQVALDGDDDLGLEPKPLVALQWGIYAFAPSRAGQVRLASIARGVGAAAAALPWSAERGRALIAQLHRTEAEEGTDAAAAAWKAALEDPRPLARFDAASIWAAVRQLHDGVLRIPYGVLVAAPETVAAVLKDEARYTVSGYRRRLVSAGMGPIFLGRDADDPDYTLLSAACNQAIQSIDMARAFNDARLAAKAVLDGWISYAVMVAADNHSKVWEAAIDVRDLVTQTLATLCETWFGINEDSKPQLFRRGALDPEWLPGDVVNYPGHFTAASRATFQPDPSEAVMRVAAAHGTALTRALRAFIEAKSVGAFASNPITRAVLEDLWEERPQDAVHTIAGAMMGFLPTTEGLLRRVLAEWTRDNTLLDLFGAAGVAKLEEWKEAEAIIAPALRRAMKFRPVPEQVWREAKVAHRLAGTADTSIEVRPGDKLVLGQVSALHAQLEQGEDSDVSGLFGGARKEGGPTHACPGYAAAMGAMVGTLAALLAPSQGQLEPSAAGSLLYRGFIDRSSGVVTFSDRLEVMNERPGQGRKLLGFGDSWLRFEWEIEDEGSDFMRSLATLGYDTSMFALPNHAKQGFQLAHMRKQLVGSGASVYATLRNLLKDGSPPLAVLVGGGGNDFVDGAGGGLHIFPFCENQGVGSVLDKVLGDPGNLQPFVALMQQHLHFIVTELHRAGEGRVPVIVQAYDHPYPDGTGVRKAMCPSLQPAFLRKKLTKLEDNARAMATFIDALNVGYAETVKTLVDKDGVNARFVRLTGVLASTPAFAQHGFKGVWKNEMHPNRAGFAALAQRLHEEALAPLLVPIP
ncbi:hypothetical protein KAK07_19710 [Ideonella sp. 4Y16]|uniref:hypothetical protein n=1 Tax=Ideonella alba TaxID=2824118 RepID=UPI001B390F2B|nr:hypothetical protein [Ideonella alba]MBQ0945576.1 hypothetical protein [Ideonella alba]